MNITKTLAGRMFGKVKQNKSIPYEFNLYARAGFKSTKKEVNLKLMDDIIAWGEKHGVKIEVTKKYNHLFGIDFIVRDYRAIELILNASDGFIIKNGKKVFL